MPHARMDQNWTSWLGHSLAAVCLIVACGRTLAADPIIVTSSSKQFIVRGKMQTSSVSSSSQMVAVDPALLTMICERVRLAMQQELGWEKRWRDSIFVNIYPSPGSKERPYIRALPAGARGWQYRIEMPDRLSQNDVVEPLVEALLIEYADRGAREESVELPPWLVPGLTEHLVNGRLAGLSLQVTTLHDLEAQPQLRAARTFRQQDVETALRTAVHDRGTLTVDQLNWPDYDENDAKADAAYRTSAHLFVRELVRLHDGPECIRNFLTLLPEHLNWQSAFLRGFESHFSRMLDVEKWWSLVLVKTKTREQSIAWSAAESQARLEELLYTPMQVRLTKDEIPHVAPVSLQTLMSDWEFHKQEPILRGKVEQLAAMRLHMPQEFANLGDQYRLAIDQYLAVRTSKKMAGRHASDRQVKKLLGSIQVQLAMLDERRMALNARVSTPAPQSPP